MSLQYSHRPPAGLMGQEGKGKRGEGMREEGKGREMQKEADGEGGERDGCGPPSFSSYICRGSHDLR